MRKYLILFAIGAAAYVLVELIWRGYSHWTMAILGGLCFLMIGGINNWIPWAMPLPLQCIIGAGIVTMAELVAGLVLNVWLGIGIWDYSNLPYNFMAQICPQFTAAWVGLSLLAILLDDWIRYKLFGEEKPHYRLW